MHHSDGPDPTTHDAARLEAVRTLARASRLLERASGELSLAHYRVLAAVAAGDERASRVAARLALGKPAVSASVEQLVRRGLLEREEHASDSRVCTLRLTPAGRRTLGDVEAAMLTRLEAVLGCTDGADDVVAALRRLGAGLDAAVAARVAAGHGAGQGVGHGAGHSAGHGAR